MDFKGADPTRRSKIEFDASVDKITKMQIWANGKDGDDNKAIGKLVIEASNGQKLNVANDYAHEMMPYDVDVKGGILLGMLGRAGRSIDALEFVFAKDEVKSLSIEDMVLSPSFEEINQRTSNEARGFEVEYLDQIHHVNNLDTATDVWLRGEKSFTETQSLTQTSSDTFHLGMGFDYKVSAGVPGVSSVEYTLSTNMFWETKSEQSNTKSTSTTVTKAWQQIATAQPGEAIYCYAWTFKTIPIDITWTGTMRVTFYDGSILEYPSRGAYLTAQYSRVNTVCEEESREQAGEAMIKGANVKQYGAQLSPEQIAHQ